MYIWQLKPMRRVRYNGKFSTVESDGFGTPIIVRNIFIMKHFTFEAYKFFEGWRVMVAGF